MSFTEPIATLYRMRALENEGDDIEVIEDILNELAFNGRNTIIPDLCLVMHDDIVEPYINDDIIETIFYIAERNGLEDGLYELVRGIPKMLPDAEFCAKRIHKTLMNSEGLIIPYIHALNKTDESIKQLIIDILHEIKEEQPDRFSEKVKMIVEQLEPIK